MGLYGLTDFQLLWERSTDTKCGCIALRSTSLDSASQKCSTAVYTGHRSLGDSPCPMRRRRCILAWNTHIGVLAFRGTASVANALADIQASPHTDISVMSVGVEMYGCSPPMQSLLRAWGYLQSIPSAARALFPRHGALCAPRFHRPYSAK